MRNIGPSTGEAMRRNRNEEPQIAESNKRSK